MMSRKALRFSLRSLSNEVRVDSGPHMPKAHMDKYRNPAPATTDIDSQVLANSTNRGVFWLAPTATTMIMVPATLAALKGLVRPLQPDRGVLAASSVEIDLSSVPEGECVTFKFREKPLFIRHRSEDQMANSDSLDISTLRDPQGVKERCRADPKWFIALAVCTHLGCVPIPDVGNHANGGYFCPCHGSHYDELGRIRAGPAPLNLEVPEYQFLDENLVKVG